MSDEKDPLATLHPAPDTGEKPVVEDLPTHVERALADSLHTDGAQTMKNRKLAPDRLVMPRLARSTSLCIAPGNQLWSSRDHHDGLPDADRNTLPGGQVPAPGTRAGLPVGLPEAPTGFPPVGKMGADFLIQTEIGHGGMGTVYLARQGTLARDVAVKLAHIDPTNKEVSERRFISEALVTAELDHPNIVPVHELARDQTGRLYTVMKLVRGTSWERLVHPEPNSLRPRELKLRDHLEILLKVGDAVAFAHARGIVHRDLKPANVMVGEFGEVLVMDWGIAVDVDLSPGHVGKTETREHTGGLAGTPCYMSPEQARGDAAALSYRTDVFLLGAVLYELLTGTPPHKGKKLREVLTIAASGAITPPEIRALHRTVPAGLSRIAQKALAADPGDRFESALAFQTALREYMAHEESARLAEEAKSELARIAGGQGVTPERRYAAWSEVLARVTESLHLWPANRVAQECQAEAAAAFADEALDRGDIGLASTQLAVLDANPLADPTRKAALVAGIRAQRMRRSRGFAGALGILAFVGLIYASLGPWLANVRAQGRDRSLELVLGRTVTGAWSAVRDGDVKRVAAARVELERPAYSGLPRAAERRQALAWGHAVLLWSRGQWNELFDVLVDAPEIARADGPALARRIVERREVAGTGLAERLAPLAKGEPRSGREVLTVVAEAARLPLPLGGLAAALDEIEKALTPAGPPGSVEGARRVALIAASVFTIAHEAARQRGDLPRMERAAQGMLSFRMERDPLAAADTSVASAPVALVRDADGAWIALDGISGRERWRSMAGLGAPAVAAVVPGARGTILFAAQGQVVSLESGTGRVVGRALVDGTPLALWPDPVALDRLMVTLEENVAGGYTDDVPVALGPGARSGTLGLARAAAALARHAEKTGSDPRAGLASELARDPDNVDLALTLLEEDAKANARKQAPLPAAARARLLATVERSAAWPPAMQVRQACALERLGERTLADRTFARALAAFHKAGGNADLATQAARPAVLVRELGGELFAHDPERALALLEIARGFSTYLSGDAMFYLRGAVWLSSRGRPAEAHKLAERAEEARGTGGPARGGGPLSVATDMLLLVFLLMPVLLAGQLLRLWYRSVRTVRADLYARGIRTGTERVITFVSQPWDRLRHVFLAYASRLERFTLVASGVLFVATGTFVAGSLHLSAELAMLPPEVTAGFAASDGFRRFVEDRIAQAPSAAGCRLMAESHFRRGESALARGLCVRALELEPQDAWAANNLAVLDELAGRDSSAAARYPDAARGDGEAAAVAAWNVARRARTPGEPDAAVASMAHRDAAAARVLPATEPMWARVGFSDLAQLMVGRRSLWLRARAALVQVLDGELVAVAHGIAAGGALGNAIGLVEAGGTVVGYLVTFVAFWALVWLPFPVRPLRPENKEPRSRGAVVGALYAAARRAARFRRAATALFGLAVPGSWDLAQGQLALGWLKLLLLIGCAAVRVTAAGGGLLGVGGLSGAGRGYFPGVPDLSLNLALLHAGEVAGWALVLLFVINAPFTLVRAARAGAFRLPQDAGRLGSI